jgi:hypothetical protein
MLCTAEQRQQRQQRQAPHALTSVSLPTGRSDLGADLDLFNIDLIIKF